MISTITGILLIIWFAAMMLYGTVTSKGVDDSKISATLMFLWRVSILIYLAIAAYARGL